MAHAMTTGSGRKEPMLLWLRQWCQRAIGAGWRAGLGRREEVPQMSQPLAAIVEALEGLHRRREELDASELSSDSPDGRERALALRQEQLEAIDHLEQAMACVDPSHLREATVQVLIAANRVEGLQEDAEDVALTRELEIVRRLLRRAAPVLAHAADLDLKRFDAAGGL